MFYAMAVSGGARVDRERCGSVIRCGLRGPVAWVPDSAGPYRRIRVSTEQAFLAIGLDHYSKNGVHGQ
jgi:hypothetical protein